MTPLLKNRVAVLVGAGSPGDTVSNGRATALTFAREGADLLLVDRDDDALAACADALASSGVKVATARVDATREDDVLGLFDRCRREYGKLDVLHNNIGMASAGRLTKTNEAAFDTCVSVNLKSIFFLCKHALPMMEEQGSGVITNISSISSIRHLGINSPLYDMTKAGLNGLTRHIAVQYGPRGIRANSILVGMMDTPLARGGIRAAGREIDEIYGGYVDRIPLRRMGTGYDTAHLAAFLASDLGAYINGAEIVVDGGLTVKSG